MDSLYGGHQGVSFILKDSFHSIDEMVAAFKSGSAYTNVWYNEYCIIDTRNKNDKDNGKIYQRGLNFQNKMGGALYVGKIVGPSSGTPYLSLGTINDTQKKVQEALGEYEYRIYPQEYTTNSDGSHTWTFSSYDENGHPIPEEGVLAADSTKVAGIADLAVNTGGLVKGKYVDSSGKNQYNDTIRYTWVNIRKDISDPNADVDADSWYYVGIQRPYTIIDYKIHDTSPYDKQGNRRENAAEIARIDDETHPFYEYWDLGLPHGIKGDSLRRLRVITPTSSDIIYSVDAITTDPSTGKAIIGSAGYDGQAKDIANKDQIVVFDFLTYDDKLNPTPITVYVGDWKTINNVNVDAEGTLTISYTHKPDAQFYHKIQWINSISLTTGDGANGGQLTVNYNNGATPFSQGISWLKNIEIDANNGDATFTYAGTGYPLPSGYVTTDKNGNALSAGKYRLPHLLKWVTDTSLNTENGHFEMNFTNGTSISSYLDWVKDIDINESTGVITVNHTVAPTSRTSSARLKLITSASISETGAITFTFNTGDTITLNNANGTAFRLKIVETISLATSITADKHIMVKYNTDTSAQPIGDPINYIVDMVVRPSDFHLMVLYSDPKHRKTIDSSNTVVLPTGTIDSDWVSNSVVRTFDVTVPDYGANIYWFDFGPVKDDHGILVGFNLTSEDIGGADIITWLNANYPNGIDKNQTDPLTGNRLPAATAQKVVTYQPNSSDGKQDKEFYAYDYRKGDNASWYYLGTIADTGTRDVKLLNRNNVSSETISSLSSKGLLFTINTTTYSNNPIPDYWSATYTRTR